MTPFPAPAGTYLLERTAGEKEARKIPVVGFAFIQPGPVYPLCAIAHPGLALGRVLVTADGFVTDPAYGVVCGSVEEWMALSGTSAYWKPKGTAAAAAKLATDGRNAGLSEEAVDGMGRDANRAGAITFGTKSFSTNSFWRLKTEDEHDPIFQIAGESPYPKDARCEKIKRDEFLTLKKAGSPVIDPETWGSETVEEDDGMDLV